MRSRLVTRLLLSGLTLLLGLLAAEGAVRLVYGGGGDARDFSFEPITVSVQEERGRFQRHPRRFFELAPHYAHAAGHLGRYALGDWNFRNTPPEPRAPGRLRVVVLGDSCMYGVGVDAANSVPERLARALAERGLPPAQVQVLNLGVPGYSSVQIEAMLDEALAELAPDAVVFYPAAWNDQAPSMWKDDLQLERDASDPGWLTRLRRRSRLVALLAGRFEAVDPERVIDSWVAGEPLLGWRVPPDETDRRLERMFRKVREAGLGCVVAAPIHPDSTQTAHPRTDRDARAVRRIGEQLGLPVVGGPLDDIETRSARNDRLFVDYAHHSPEGTALLAEAIADALAPQLSPDPAAGDGGLRLVSVEPSSLSALGDEVLSVTVAGLDPAGPRPEVLVGGAPLLGVSVEPAAQGARVRGLVMANAAGARDVVVQAAQGTLLAPAALRLVEPWFELGAGEPPVLRFHARAGDQVRVFVATGVRDVPLWSHRGAFWLADGFLELGDLVAGDDGVAEFPLPPDALVLDAAVYVQGAAFPRGEALGDSHAARWTDVLAVD